MVVGKQLKEVNMPERTHNVSLSAMNDGHSALPPLNNVLQRVEEQVSQYEFWGHVKNSQTHPENQWSK